MNSLNNFEFPSLNNKTVVISGSTGFLGKVFLVRLLKLFPEMKKVVLIVRGATPIKAEFRVDEEIFSTELFRHLFAEMTPQQVQQIKEKILVVGGDIKMPFMGMGGDLLLLNMKPDYVINSAASVNFVEPLDEALATNVHSVQNILEFCEFIGAKFLHISTCYVNGMRRGLISESAEFKNQGAFKKIPMMGARVNTKKIIEDLELRIAKIKSQFKAVDSDQAEMKKQLTEEAQRAANEHGWFDIYTFTKWIAEQLIVSQQSVNFRILRPSIIESTLNFPFPGWIEGFKVADPLIHFGGNGMVRFFPGNSNVALDLIPVDKVADAMVLALFSFFKNDPIPHRIFQVCSGSENPLMLSKMTQYGLQAYKRPSIIIPFFIPLKAFKALTGCALIWTKLNLLVAQQFKKVVRVEKILRRMKMIRKLFKLANIYQNYTSLQCTYENKKLLELNHWLVKNFGSEIDISTKPINWQNYIVDIHVPGLRRFVIDPAEKNSAERVQKPVVTKSVA